MSRKERFEQYILNSTSVKAIRCAGQGEDGRVVRAGLVVAAREGHAVALKALFPLVDTTPEFLHAIVDFAVKHPHASDILSSIPSNTAVPTYDMERSVYGCSDAIQSQLVRIYELSAGSLWSFAYHAGIKDSMLTLTAALKKNKNVSATLLADRWRQFSPQVCQHIIAHTKDLNVLLHHLKAPPSAIHLPSTDATYDCVIQWVESEQAKRLRSTLVDQLGQSDTVVKPRKRKM